MARKTKTVSAEDDVVKKAEPVGEAVPDETMATMTEVAAEEPAEPFEEAPLDETEYRAHEPDPTPPLESARDRKQGGGGWIGTVLGGAMAAGLGFGAAHYLNPTSPLPAISSEDLAALKASLKTQDADLSAVEARLAAMPAAASPEEVQALDARLSAIESRATDAHAGTDADLASLGERLAMLETRLQALERRPIAGGGVSDAAIQSFEDELGALRAELEGQRAEGKRMQEEVASVADAAEARLKAAEDEAARIRAQADAEGQRALARAAVIHLRAALESGAPIDGALGDIAATGITVPAELTDQAQGVPTLQMLQARFEPAARESLAASLRDTAGEGWLDKTMAFLRSQSGARSLTPRAGDDPDAVLSRAAAALGAGDIGGAVSEIDGLPQAGQDIMAEWIALAGRRMAAVAAVQTLSKALD